jgi:hypothetical protein
MENEKEMIVKKNFSLIIAGLFLLLANATNLNAQVRRVEMHIGGYLCGN